MNAARAPGATLNRDRQLLLRRIDGTLTHMLRGNPGPRAIRAFWTSVLFSGATIGAYLYLPAFRDWVLGLATASHVAFVASWCVMFLLIRVAVLRLSDAPRTWEDRLDDLLTNYPPRDLEAYQDLQQVTRNAGRLEPDAVRAWLVREGNAVHEQIRDLRERDQRPKTYRFLEINTDR
ncbi:hypothetical protein [Cupriavidus pauculus]|uniref:hypothetical protein n=1 Tax=Cupriavidus pauculus TaxID=82633 RepID=UPI003857915F